MPQNKDLNFWFVAPLLGILFFHMVCESMVVPILAPTLAEPVSERHDMLLGYSVALHKFFYGLALAVYPILVFFCAPVIGVVSDTIGRRPVLVAALAGTILGCVGQGLGMEFLSVGMFIAGRALVGATAGVDGVIQAALLDRCGNDKQKNFYLGASLLAMSIGFMTGPAFAAIMIDEKADALAWSIPFFMLALTFVFMLAVLWKKIPSKEKISKADLKKIKWSSGLTDIAILFKIKSARQLLMIFVSAEIAGGCYVALSPLVLSQTFEFSVREIAVFLSLEGVFSSIVFAVIGPQMLARFSKNFILRFSMSMCIVTCGMLYFKELGSFIWADAFFMAMGFSLSYYIILSMFSDTTDEHRRGWLLSVLSSLWGLTMGTGLMLCGIIVGISNNFALAVCVMLCVMAFLFSIAKIRTFKINSKIPVPPNRAAAK